MLAGGRDFLEVFRIRFEANRSLKGVERVVALRGWFAWLCARAPTAEILREIRQETISAVAQYGRLCADVGASLSQVAADVASATQDLAPALESKRASAKLLDGAGALARTLDELRERANAPALPFAWTRFPESPDAAFSHLRDRVAASEAFADHDARQTLIIRLQHEQWDAQSKFTSLMLDLAAGGGHSLAVFQYLAGALGVACDQVPLQNAGMPSIDPVTSIRTALFGPREVAPSGPVETAGVLSDGLQQWESLFRLHAENLHRALLLRLVERRHHTTALARYGTRAELYDLDRLRSLVETNPGRVEAVLAADCAKYLFDCGFDVATEFVLGNVRADILATDLYVEAKQVGENDAAKAKVLAGYRQTLGSARRLRDRPGGIPTLALVIFVVGGVLVSAPAAIPAWHSSPPVDVHVVDLRIAQQGAAERRPVVVTKEEFQKAAEEEAGPN